MYMHTLARFCESRRCFSLLSPLNILHTLFCLLSLFPPCCRVSSSFPSSTTPQARGHPRPSLLLPSFLPLVLPMPPAFCVCALKLSGGLLCVLLCVVLLPSLVSRQAQNGVTVWADAPRIYPRPCLLLPMCCRVSRWLFRGFRPSVRGLSCCLLPGVVWW